jgi:hypothetical protein
MVRSWRELIIEEVSGKAHERIGPTRPQTSSRQLQERIQGAHGALGVAQPGTVKLNPQIVS